MPFSPKQQYCGQTVLLTGGLGYLGSIVLEQLLRLTEVREWWAGNLYGASNTVCKLECCTL
jgi:UDP-glucose 4-epimerase